MFNDPIKKAFFIFHNTVNYAIALRKNGDVDLYWNMQRVDSSTSLGATDVAISFDTMYLQLTNS